MGDHLFQNVCRFAMNSFCAESRSSKPASRLSKALITDRKRGKFFSVAANAFRLSANIWDWYAGDF